jgi:hypothetical protein
MSWMLSLANNLPYLIFIDMQSNIYNRSNGVRA